jgi:16S rRNA U1498 N3-methylase RsmE
VDIRDSSGDRAKRKCVQIKLTAIGTVVENVGVVNSKENVQNMSELLQFASTQSEIERL